MLFCKVEMLDSDSSSHQDRIGDNSPIYFLLVCSIKDSFSSKDSLRRLKEGCKTPVLRASYASNSLSARIFQIKASSQSLSTIRFIIESQS